MDVPPEIAFRNLDATPDLKQRILDGIDELERVHDHLVSCRVMVEDTTPDRHSGSIYRVRLDLGVPNHSIVVDRKPRQLTETRDVSQAITEAFNRARRRLIDAKKKQRGKVKTHSLPPHGRVARLLTDDGVRYGFLLAEDGREIYFHENSLVNLSWDDLDVGTEVRFAEAGGEEGPHASTVAPLNHHAQDPRHEEEIPLNSHGAG